MIHLLDNNVLSELWKEKPDPNVRAWFFSSAPLRSVVFAEERSRQVKTFAMRLLIQTIGDNAVTSAVLPAPA